MGMDTGPGRIDMQLDSGVGVGERPGPAFERSAAQNDQTGVWTPYL
jgi:hypothetical protein